MWNHASQPYSASQGKWDIKYKNSYSPFHTETNFVTSSSLRANTEKHKLLQRASNNHSNTTDSYFSATSTTDVQETARGYVTLRRDVAYYVLRRSKRQHRASVPTRLASFATGEAIEKGLYSTARLGRRTKGRWRGAEGVRAVAPCALIGTLNVYKSLFNDAVRK
jgi:hypothetical protein